ncbi:MAG TPA: SprT-like domain-containing protein [Chitinophagaceae bacterium]|nr:SprT-like domain-containing protein [Chitinophagaceae bacterium]
MPKKEVPVDHLQQFLPPGTGAAVIDYLHQYKVHLTIAAERTSILGDYRHRTHHANHRISVNGNLNTYSFLITLLHEIAHLLTFEQYGNKVQAHGKEWKMIFGQLLQQFVRHKIFPADIEKELLQSLKNPAASSCAEEGLLRVLRNYDAKKSNHHLVEEIAPGTLFRIKDGRVFRKGEQLRKRFKCIEIKTGKMYLFSPVYEIELLPAD